MLTRAMSPKLRAVAAILAAIVSLAGPMHLAFHGALSSACCARHTQAGVSAAPGASPGSHAACVVCVAVAASAVAAEPAPATPFAGGPEPLALPSASLAQRAPCHSLIRGPPSSMAA